MRRNRALYIMKSRGMKHSKEVREFAISSTGLKLIDVTGDQKCIGSARQAKEKEIMAKAKQNGRGELKLSAKKIR